MSEKISHIKIKPLGFSARFADRVFAPIMRLGSVKLGDVKAWHEAPQETHWWNNHRLSCDCVKLLDTCSAKIVHIDADPTACEKGLFRFHMPLFGGWKNYVVVSPTCLVNRDYEWYVGWVSDHGMGISRIPLVGPVRLLRAPKKSWAFGISSNGCQIMIKQIGEGATGDGGEFSQVHLR